ncbi:TPA: hypothetical protein I9786_003783 [Serratia marcescens]|nr:hypothetical protein [Serratia marcescens]HAT5031639.1 hypothetical protein [Serratia marcescens]
MRQKRKKRQKALFSELVGRAGLIRPVASPCGQRCALSYRCAMLEPLRLFILHDSVNSVGKKMKSGLGGAETKKAPKGAFF